jgi:hypothetical protein
MPANPNKPQKWVLSEIQKEAIDKLSKKTMKPGEVLSSTPQQDAESWGAGMNIQFTTAVNSTLIKSPKKKASPLFTTNSRIKLLKVGADVEEFLRDAKGNPVPVIGLIGGTKDKPLPILTHMQGYALQEDNVALEYNIPAAGTSADFVYSLMRIREEINERVAKHGLVPAIEASMRFDKKQLEHPQARVFGCDPDFNVWEQAENEKPNASPASETLRTAGGHVHVSFLIDDKRPEFLGNLADVEAIVMAMDVFLGIPFARMDKDKDRRLLYGKAGAFRFKEEYGGVEYRVLSNYWTRSPLLMEYTFNQTQAALAWVSKSDNPRGRLFEYKRHVYDIINDGKLDYAGWMMDRFGLEMPTENKKEGKISF